VELRYKKLDDLSLSVEVKTGWQDRRARPQFLVPLTCDVVRNIDPLKCGEIGEHREHEIVHVNISNRAELSPGEHRPKGKCVPLSPLQVTNTICHFHVMSCAINSADTSSSKALQRLGVRHIHCIVADAGTFLSVIGRKLVSLDFDSQSS
jgi:hypothetical protein